MNGPEGPNSGTGAFAGAIPVVILFALTGAVFGRTLGHGFVINWDDDAYVLSNAAILGFSAGNLRRIFTGYFIGNYAPVHLFSYLVDHALWGLRPWGYHATNLLLHAGNGLILYRLLLRIRLGAVPACAAACLFVVHPVQVETVAWISQRKTLLALFFFLLALERYLDWRRDPARRGSYVFSLVFLALALLSKSAAIFFPAAAWLSDRCLSGDERRRPTRVALIPHLVLALGAGVLTLVSQTDASGHGRTDYPGGGPGAAALTMLPVLAQYLRDCLWPHDLLPYYLTVIRTEPDGVVWFSAALGCGLILLGARLWRSERRAFFFYVFFFLALAPVSQIVPINTLKNDRYLYFPLVGYAGMLGVSADFAARRWRARGATLAVAAALLLCGLALQSVRQAAVWKDDVTLWGWTTRRQPENLLGWKMLAKTRTQLGDRPGALEAAGRYLDLERRHGPLRGGL